MRELRGYDKVTTKLRLKSAWLLELRHFPCARVCILQSYLFSNFIYKLKMIFSLWTKISRNLVTLLLINTLSRNFAVTLS